MWWFGSICKKKLLLILPALIAVGSKKRHTKKREKVRLSTLRPMSLLLNLNAGIRQPAEADFSFFKINGSSFSSKYI